MFQQLKTTQVGEQSSSYCHGCYKANYFGVLGLLPQNKDFRNGFTATKCVIHVTYEIGSPNAGNPHTVVLFAVGG